MMQEENEKQWFIHNEQMRELYEPQYKKCSLCGLPWHIDDMDEEYPDCCKSCVEATSDLEGEL